ncbi:COMM domain-containing protein 7 [Pyxicephalus adspersus]|uniref:COMM domain-containing protein 7 n=1 Tax=Pyxicephalus adspersus TaxID=30357 RepID=UPI003B5A8317
MWEETGVPGGNPRRHRENLQTPCPQCPGWDSNLGPSAGALKRNLKSEELKADLIVLGLHEEKAAYFADEWSHNAATLSGLAVSRTLSINQLVDMEWKFGVTAASSELEKAGSIFLQLKMVIRKGSQLEPVYVELTLPQFYSFLHEMERAKNSLECFT